MLKDFHDCCTLLRLRFAEEKTIVIKLKVEYWRVGSRCPYPGYIPSSSPPFRSPTRAYVHRIKMKGNKRSPCLMPM